MIGTLRMLRGLAVATILLAPGVAPATHTAEGEPVGPELAPEAEAGRAPVRKVEQSDVAATTSGAWRLGSFNVYPELATTGFYDDNVFATRDNREDDYAVVISPALWVQSDWERHALNLRGSADITRYADFSSENTEDFRGSSEGRYDFTDDTNAYGGIAWAREHEDRESKDDLNGIEPTLYYERRGYAGVFHQAGRVSVRVAGTAESFDFKDVPFRFQDGTLALINNDDRDRDRYTAGVRVGYEISTRYQVFAQAATDNRIYDDKVDDLGLHRDSRGTRLIVGLRAIVPRTLKFEGFFGHMRQNYDDALLSDVSRPAVGGVLVWQPTENTVVNLYGDRTIEETTVFTITPGPVVTSASSYVNSYFGGRVQHALSAHMVVQAFGSFSRSDYVGVDRQDDYIGVGFGVGYRVARHVYADVAYSYRKLDSSAPAEDFQRNLVSLRLSFTL